MKNKKIDEMQEQKRLKIDSNGLWIAFFGLIVAYLVQTALFDADIRSIAGECIVIIALAIYLVPSYIMNGIWSTASKPSAKANLVLSLVAGLGTAAFWGISSYVRYGKLAGSIATGAFMFIFTFALCIAVLSFFFKLYQMRVEKLENAPETDDEKPLI